MTESWEQSEGGLLFLDDDPEWTELLEDWASKSKTAAIVTTQPDKLETGLMAGSINTVVTDLRMPGVDVVRILERAYNRYPDVRLIVLSGFEPDMDEHRRLAAIGAKVVLKSAVSELLDELAESAPPVPTKKRVDMQARISELETENRSLQAHLRDTQDLHKQWTTVMADRLRKMPEGEKSIIYFRDEAFSVAELIKDLEQVTPRGIEFLRLWASALSRFTR